jgi:hypothetical protein
MAVHTPDPWRAGGRGGRGRQARVPAGGAARAPRQVPPAARRGRLQDPQGRGRECRRGWRVSQRLARCRLAFAAQAPSLYSVSESLTCRVTAIVPLTTVDLVSYAVHPVLCRSSSTAAPDVAASFGSYDNSGGGAAWWQEWEPSASEARQQQQQQQRQQQQQQAPHRPRPWQPPADSDAQVLTTLTTQVSSGHALTYHETLRWQLFTTHAVLS